MSDYRAIAAVTAALRKLLQDKFDRDADIPGVHVFTFPPDKAQDGDINRVNLFLYHTTVNAAWRNRDMPDVKSGEGGHPPLALNLHYLLSAYSQDDEGVNLFTHRLLGRAMSILHDSPVLDRELIREALSNNDLYRQIERVRLTLQSLSLEEMFKLWGAFQTPYRISVAYQVSVVLIESQRAVSAPLPVLQRGQDDQGIISQPDLIPQIPTLTGLTYPHKQPGLRLGDELAIHGHHLAVGTASILFIHPRLDKPIEAEALPGNTDTQLAAKPDNNSYLCGIYRLTISLDDGNQIRSTNELSLRLVPALTIPSHPVREKEVEIMGEMVMRTFLTLLCEPAVLPAQQVSVLLGSHQIPAEAWVDQTDTLEFDITDVDKGEYLLRLRVDGVDSLPVKDYTATPMTFDEAQKVTIDG